MMDYWITSQQKQSKQPKKKDLNISFTQIFVQDFYWVMYHFYHDTVIIYFLS